MRMIFFVLLMQFYSTHSFPHVQDQISRDWKTCSLNEDCVAGSMGCWAWVPINKKHVYGTNNYIEGANINCLSSVDPGPRPKVECRHGTCERTGKPDPHPEIACTTDADCVVIKYDCNQGTAINVKHLSEMREKLCKCHDCISTDCSQFNSHGIKGVCMNHYECGAEVGGAVYNSIKERDSLPDPKGEKWNKRFIGKPYPDCGK